ncbi:MAG: MarR family winged helix-turn-helix transcriptional regulator [Haliea sp.]
MTADQWLSSSLLHLMRARGHKDLTGAHLAFFAFLECGLTHASDVARRMGISRQAVYKVTRDLERIGVLRLEEDPTDRRQKLILMTARGDRVALDARASLAEIEARIEERIGPVRLDQLRGALARDWGAVLGLEGDEPS